jgi:hypothetical protein
MLKKKKLFFFCFGVLAFFSFGFGFGFSVQWRGLRCMFSFVFTYLSWVWLVEDRLLVGSVGEADGAVILEITDPGTEAAVVLARPEALGLTVKEVGDAINGLGGHGVLRRLFHLGGGLLRRRLGRGDLCHGLGGRGLHRLLLLGRSRDDRCRGGLGNRSRGLGGRRRSGLRLQGGDLRELVLRRLRGGLGRGSGDHGGRRRSVVLVLGGRRRTVLGLVVGDEGVVRVLILLADGLGDGKALLLQGDALKAVCKLGLAVLHEGDPGEGADRDLTLRLILRVLGLGGLADLTALALLADGSGDALVENELVGEGQLRDLGNEGIDGRLSGRHFSVESGRQ